MAGREDDGIAVTAVLLKQESGQFDLEGILQVELSCRGIRDVAVLGLCVSLQRLDLSDNLISSISVLGSLKNLRYINIARNRLKTLDGVESMEELQYINAAGNSLVSLTILEPLRGKQQLGTIILQERSQHLTNPVCQTPEYRTKVLELFPHLRVLDGEHVSGSGKELFELFHELDSKLSDTTAQSSVVSKPEPFLHDGFWDYKPDVRTDDGEVDSVRRQLELLTNQCKELNSQAMTVILREQNRPTEEEST